MIGGDGQRRGIAMSKIVLPYEPNYIGGRDAEKRRKTREWLRELQHHPLVEDAPPTAPVEPTSRAIEGEDTCSTADGSKGYKNPGNSVS
jgi:hypothetical protein